MKVVLAHRVLPHWRTPVFRRLAAWPGIDFLALHGSDFPGTKTVNGRDLSGFAHRELWTLRLVSRITDEREIAFPLWPTFPWHLWRERPDVLFSMGSIAYPTRVPQAVLYHWPYAIYPEPEIWSRMTGMDRANRGIRRWLFGRRAHYATRFAAQTETARGRLERLWGLTNVSIVPNAVSLPTPREDAASGPAVRRAREAVPEGHRALLCLSRYYPHKNLDAVTRVCRLIRDRGLPFVVLTTVSASDDRSAGDWIDQVRSEGLEDVLVNLGTVPMQDVPGLYDLASGLLLPTLMESFSGTYVESMYYGKPVFTSDRDFARDVCDDVAYYFDPHDPEAILGTVEAAFADPEELARRVAAGQARCEQFAKWPEVTRRYVELFERVAAEARAS